MSFLLYRTIERVTNGAAKTGYDPQETPCVAVLSWSLFPRRRSTIRTTSPITIVAATDARMNPAALFWFGVEGVPVRLAEESVVDVA